MTFRDLLTESAKPWDRLEPKKNWKDIVTSFDEVTEIIIQPNGKSLRIRGTKDNNGADMYVDFNNKEVAKEVYEKVKATIK